MTTWWDTALWHAYERACEQEPGTRASLLRAAAWKTRVVDLSLSEPELWRAVRKSYRPIITRITNQYPNGRPSSGCGRRVLSGICVDEEVEAARQLHAEDAGRQTRSAESWRLMARWAQVGNGLITCAYGDRDPIDRRLVAYVYFIRWGDWAYYASAASARRNLNLAAIWWSMLALKALGVRWCEVGWQGQGVTDKELHIEFTRRGFGGYDIPVGDTLTPASVTRDAGGVADEKQGAG